MGLCWIGLPEHQREVENGEEIGKDEAMSDGIRGQAGKVATRAGMI